MTVSISESLAVLERYTISTGEEMGGRFLFSLRGLAMAFVRPSGSAVSWSKSTSSA
ncbi:MAG: hypothetical protein KKA60_06810 [Proteobacteria bacterium]|nr:hypothetical protein [Pseudomonadota bacterium]